MQPTPSFEDTLALLQQQHQQGSISNQSFLEQVGLALSQVPEDAFETACQHVVKALGERQSEFSAHYGAQPKLSLSRGHAFVNLMMADVARHHGVVDLEKMAAEASLSSAQVKAIVATPPTKAGLDALEKEPAFKVLVKHAKSLATLERALEDNDELRYNEDKTDRHVDRMDRHKAEMGKALATLPAAAQPESIRVLHAFIQDLYSKENHSPAQENELERQRVFLRTNRCLSVESAQTILNAMATQEDTYTKSRRSTGISVMSGSIQIPEEPSVKKRAPRP